VPEDDDAPLLRTGEHGHRRAAAPPR
jgi:hypothetical protein